MNSIIINLDNDLPQSLLNPETACGFPSPAEDHIEHNLDLNKYLITHPVATYFVRAQGAAMRDIGILHGDLLVVDRSLTPGNNSIVIVEINGEFLVKRLRMVAGKGSLYAANSAPIAIADLEGLQFWGVVTHAIHDVRPG